LKKVIEPKSSVGDYFYGSWILLETNFCPFFLKFSISSFVSWGFGYCVMVELKDWLC